jgi:WD40 repeat protein
LAAQTPEQVEGSVLLAAESFRREPTVEAQTLLIRSVGLLPKSLPDLVQKDAELVSYSPDGKRIATADEGGTIVVRNAENGKIVNTLKTREQLFGLWLLNDRVVTAHAFGPPEVLALGEKHVYALGCESDSKRLLFSGLAVSPDGGHVLVKCEMADQRDHEFLHREELVLWTLVSEDPQVSARIRPRKSVRRFAVSNHGKWIALVSEDHVQFYSVAKRKFGDSDNVGSYPVALSFDGHEQLIAVGKDGRIRTWEASDTENSDENRLTGFGTAELSHAEVFGEKGVIIASGRSRAVGVWQTSGDQLATAVAGSAIVAFGVSANEFCALARGGTLQRWHLPGSMDTTQLGSVGIFSQDGKWLIKRSGNKWAIQNTISGQHASGGEGSESSRYYPLLFDPSGKYVAVRGRTRTGRRSRHSYPEDRLEVRTFDAGTIGSTVLGEIALPSLGDTDLMKFSPDSTKLTWDYYSPDEEDRFDLQVWDWKTGKVLEQRNVGRGRALPFFSPDSETAFWDKGGQLSSWSLADNRLGVVSLPRAGRRSAWTTLAAKGLAACGVTSPHAPSPDDEGDDEDRPDGTTTGNQVIVWSYPHWAELARLDHPDLIFSVAFNSDGTRLLSVTRDGTIRLWDWRRKEQLAMIPTAARIAAAAVLDDQRVAVLQTGRLRTYWWQPEKLRQEVCDLVNHNLTLSEWKGYQLEVKEFPKTKLCPKLP